MPNLNNSIHFTRWIPSVFVLLWSTGFIGAKYALPYIEPFNLLFIRMLATLAVFTVLIVLFRAKWPSPVQAFHQIVVGALVHAAYLGGVFAAIKWGMSAGLASLLVGLQPLLTAILVLAIFSERMTAKQWAGLFLGLLGVSLILLQGQDIGSIQATQSALIAVSISLLGISIGTMYQKRFGTGVNLLTGSFFQYFSTACCMATLTFMFEDQHIVWHPELIGALVWLVFGLSVSAILLLMHMIREGESTKVASYFYLVPPVTALEAWLLFDETLSMIALVGMLVTVYGVYLVVKVRKYDQLKLPESD